MKYALITHRAVALTSILTFLLFGAYAQPAYPTDPAEAEIHFTDIEHFAEAYLALEDQTDTLEVLRRYYFDRATPGLKEFINRHGLSPEMLKVALKKYPDRYALIPTFLKKKEEITIMYKDLMKGYKTTLPNSMLAPTWLLVGANRGIGQASFAGQLITITRVSDDMELIKKLIIHELTHFQQAMTMGGEKYISLYSQENNMLGLCLREGGAEFITSLLLGDITQSKSLAYLKEHEPELKERFHKDVNAQKKAYWLWDSLNQKDNPGLLGYVMGYKICKTYYDQTENKKVALEAILRMEDPTTFLQASGYYSE